MNKTMFGIGLMAPLAFSCTGKKSSGSAEKQELPNIILILCDDMGFSDLGCYGSSIETPNLDKLAKNGVRFNQFHNTSKSFPSRACLLTGVYAQNCNMDKRHDTIKNAVTIAEVLKSAGYRTLMVGKHHGLENMYNRGFDRYYGLRDGCCNYFNPGGQQRPGEPVPAHKTWAKPRKWCIDSLLIKGYTPTEKDFYTTDYFTNYALQYLEEYKNEDKPFFLYAAYTAPHDPLHAWPEDQKKYFGKFMDGYEAERKRRYQKQLDMGLIDQSFPLSDPMHRPWDELTEEEKRVEDSLMATHAAMIDRMDQNIGRILAKIEEMGETENTIVMFMSDNGCQPGMANVNAFNETSQDYPIGTIGRWASISKSLANVGDTPFRYFKTWSHEGGTCTPFIAYWPSVIKEKNRIIDFPGHFIDVLPTILEITGADYPKRFNIQEIVPVKGISLLPLMKNENIKRYQPIYWQWAKGKAIRKDNWKLVSGNNGPWELYDMSVDKTEMNNLAYEKTDVVNQLDSLYKKWYSRYSN